MENTPLITENDAEKSTKKDKKKSKLGLMAVKKESPIQAAKPEKKPAQKPETKEIEPVSEAEAPLEKPSKAETEEVIRPRLVEVIEQLESGQPPDPATDAPVEQFRELVKSGERPETAFDEVMAELGIDEFELNALDDIEAEDIESKPEVEPNTPYFAELSEDEVMIDLSDEVGSAEKDELPTTPPVPPRGPHPPAGGQFGAAGFGPPGGPSVWKPNHVPVAPTKQNKAEYKPDYGQASPAAMALFGGIIGYLVGRRRGRIKTEKKLLPVQKKLEKQVENMQFDLQQKEKKIRRIAAAKVEKNGPVVIEKFKEALAQKAPDKVDERRRAPEANILHMPTHKPEHLGHMMVRAEAKPQHEKAPSKNPEKMTDSRNQPLTERRVETLNRAELLEISNKIEVNGSTLRQIYDTHLIGERGLRRLVSEHLRGGDIKKALQNEIVEREIDFERDPALRDMAPSHSSAPPAGGKAALNHLVNKATANIGDNSEEAAFIRARANYETEQYHQQQKQRQVIDVLFASIILVLLGLVILLFITRQ